MTTINVTNFRKDIYNLVDETIKYNQPLSISTKNGTAVLISEEDYNNMMETLYIESVPGLKEEIIDRANSKDEEFVSEEEVNW